MYNLIKKIVEENVIGPILDVIYGRDRLWRRTCRMKMDSRYMGPNSSKVLLTECKKCFHYDTDYKKNKGCRYLEWSEWNPEESSLPQL